MNGPLPDPVVASTPWELPGSGGEVIIGDAHLPAGRGLPRATVLVVHGFKGSKDYGMMPALAATLAGAGCLAHRFNLSHSGMTRETDSFARADLFERDTWNRQVEDVAAVAAAARAGELSDADPASTAERPLVLLGHSRGGATCVLAAGRGAVDDPAAVVTIAAPAECGRVSDEDRATLEAGGSIVSPSARTGQELAVGPDWWREQRDDPEAHDPLVMAGRIACPLLAIHGDADPTVPVSDAERLVRAARDGRVLVLSGANHVLGVPNPFDPAKEPSPDLAGALEAILGLLDEIAVGT